MFTDAEPVPGSLADVRARMEDAVRALNAYNAEEEEDPPYNTITLVQLATQAQSKIAEIAGVSAPPPPKGKGKGKEKIDAGERPEWQWKDGKTCPGPGATWRDGEFVERMAQKRGKGWSVTLKCPRGRGYYTRRRYTCHVKGVMLCNACGQMYQRDKKKGLVMTQAPKGKKRKGR